MNHLQQARYAIDGTATAQSNEHATLVAQIAIAHAMVALVERMDKMLQLYDDKQNQLEMLAGN